MRESLLRPLLKKLASLLFRLEITGIEHIPAPGKKLVIISNHQSFLDPLLLAIFLPGIPAFAMNLFQARKWFFKPLMKLVKVFTIDPTEPMSMKSIITHVENDGWLVIFPEGRITTTGGVMKTYEGVALIVEKTHAPILTIRIEGAQYSKLSRMNGTHKTYWFPKIRLHISPPRLPNLPEHASAHTRRGAMSQWMTDALTSSALSIHNTNQTLLHAIWERAQLTGMRHPIAEDTSRTPLTYRALFAKTLALAHALALSIPHTDRPSSSVGVLLPTSLGGLITFLALQQRGITPALLNFSAGLSSIKLACQTACVQSIITSRAFIEKGKLEELIAALAEQHHIIYLEDLRTRITWAVKLKAAFTAFIPAQLVKRFPQAHASSPAVILFTSGSEGVPKGVVLSHKNILTNIHQASSKLSFNAGDTIFNALPIFHSFGLTVGSLLPLVLGIKTFLYPSPLHYRIIADMCYDTNATIMLGTDTFYRGYANYAHPFDFHNIRLAVAGAEKLRHTTYSLYAETFRVCILQGYGVTETSPIISCNTPLENKLGTVGRVFPGMECKLEPIEGLERGARLHIKGDNVMLGYMRHTNPGVIEPHSEWYDTGDIVEMDAEGYISILGRAKRFAKIGGEMVSLTAIEEFFADHWPDAIHAAIAVHDERKGEQIVLYTEQKNMDRSDALAKAKQAGLAEISIPKKIIHLEALPRLGSGKIDYIVLSQLPRET